MKHLVLFATAASLVLGTTAFATGLGPNDSPVTAEATAAWWLVGLFTLHGIVTWMFARRRYVVWKDGEFKPAFTELQEFSAYLLAGTLIAQWWVHGDPQSYQATLHTVLFYSASLDLNVTVRFLVNDVFMALFFGIAAKELVEAVMKPGGALRGVHCLLPMLACLGGVVGPALIYRSMCTEEMSSAWAVPCATDVAFAWLGARLIWGRRHPAVLFLLALAVADDFVGMGIIAFAYPQQSFDIMGLPLLGFGMGLAFTMNRLSRHVPGFRSWFLYMIPGAICWFALLMAGLHAALALMFVVPFIPMTGRDAGMFMEREHNGQRGRQNAEPEPAYENDDQPDEWTEWHDIYGGDDSEYIYDEFDEDDDEDDDDYDARLNDLNGRASAAFTDPLNQFERMVRPLVDMGLFFFGLANAGILWWGVSSWDQNSWAVLVALGVGKTLGITLLTLVGYGVLKQTGLSVSLPQNPETGERLIWRDVPLVGLLGAIGFTVALFVAEAANGQASLKLGAMASIVYLFAAVPLGRAMLRRDSSRRSRSYPDEAMTQPRFELSGAVGQEPVLNRLGDLADNERHAPTEGTVSNRNS